MGTISISFDEELSDDEQAYAGGVLRGLIERIVDQRKLAPHVVTHNPRTLSAAEGGGKRDEIVDCPDCTRGLTSRAYNGIPVRLCPRIDRPPFPEGLKPTPNDVIACGGSR